MKGVVRIIGNVYVTGFSEYHGLPNPPKETIALDSYQSILAIVAVDGRRKHLL